MLTSCNHSCSFSWLPYRATIILSWGMFESLAATTIWHELQVLASIIVVKFKRASRKFLILWGEVQLKCHVQLSVARKYPGNGFHLMGKIRLNHYEAIATVANHTFVLYKTCRYMYIATQLHPFQSNGVI